MYSFKIKAEASDIDIPAGRTILCLSLLLIVLYGNVQPAFLKPASIVIVSLAAVFTAHIIVKYRISLTWIAAAAAILTAVTTHLYIHCGIIFIMSAALKNLYVQPVVEISSNGILIKKTFYKKQYGWTAFNNIILKDNLLTLDFTNNKVLQLDVDSSVTANEKEFNSFCGQHMNMA